MTTSLHPGFSRPDNPFIPVASDDLIDYMASDEKTFVENGPKIREIANWFIRILEQEKSAFERLLIRNYSRVNPDRETMCGVNNG